MNLRSSRIFVSMAPKTRKWRSSELKYISIDSIKSHTYSTQLILDSLKSLFDVLPKFDGWIEKSKNFSNDSLKIDKNLMNLSKSVPQLKEFFCGSKILIRYPQIPSFSSKANPYRIFIILSTYNYIHINEYLYCYNHSSISFCFDSIYLYFSCFWWAFSNRVLISFVVSLTHPSFSSAKRSLSENSLSNIPLLLSFSSISSSFANRSNEPS
jgi:hypothetical protein